MRIFNRNISLHGLSQWLWLLATILIVWTLTQLPLDSVIDKITSLTLPQWLMWIGLNISLIAIANLRWWMLIRMLKQPVSFGWLLRVKQAGQAVSFITPGPQFGGEHLQIFWLYKRGLPLHKALLSLGLDRSYELIINLIVLLIAVAILLTGATTFNYLDPLAFEKWISPTFIAVLVVLAIATTVMIWLIKRKPHWLGNRFQKFLQGWAQHPHLNRLKTQKNLLVDDWKYSLQHKKITLCIAAVLSLAGWLVLLGELALLLKFVGVNLGVQEFVLILVALRLAILLPVPAGIGTMEAAIYAAFMSLHLPGGAAISLIALMRIRDVLVLISGLICWRWIQHDIREQPAENSIDTVKQSAQEKSTREVNSEI